MDTGSLGVPHLDDRQDGKASRAIQNPCGDGFLRGQSAHASKATHNVGRLVELQGKGCGQRGIEPRAQGACIGDIVHRWLHRLADRACISV